MEISEFQKKRTGRLLSLLLSTFMPEKINVIAFHHVSSFGGVVGWCDGAG